MEGEIDQFLTNTDVVCHGEDMLARMQSLADATGNPEKRLKIVHVAGTSGKTSTCYFVASLLQAAGYTTGLTVSPHVDSVRERATVNLRPLAEGEWESQVHEFFDVVKKSGVRPSYFEFYMGFAYWLFAKLGLDYAVVETGIGGTWDGSNVARRGDKVCIVTDIGYDHTEILGDDLATIAREKVGIIHRGNEVYMYPQSSEILSAAKERAARVRAKLHVQPDEARNFMVRNLNLARRAVDFVLQRDHGRTLTPDEVKQGRTVRIPARAEEIVYKCKQIIMDGSHNPQKLRAFVEYLDQRYPSGSRALVATLGSNKSATLDDSMAALRLICDRIVLTSFQDDSIETYRRTSIDQETLVAAARRAGFGSTEYVHDPMEALAQAVGGPAEQIVVTGSFFLLNHLRPDILPRRCDMMETRRRK